MNQKVSWGDPYRCISSSLIPLWQRFGIKNEAGSGPRSSLNELGANFWRLGGGEKPSRSSYAAETTVFSQFWCSKTGQDDFHGVLTSHNGHIWYKPRLGTPKSESHNELRQGAEILMEI